MDLTIEHRLSKKERKRLFRKAFFAFAAPGYVLWVIYILICVTLGLFQKELTPFFYPVAILIAILYLIAWPRTWRFYQEIFRRQGAYEHPTVIHLTDSFFETSCGENHSKQEYRIFTHYMCLKDSIVLLHNRNIASVIQKKNFQMAARNGYHAWRPMGWSKNVSGA